MSWIQLSLEIANDQAEFASDLFSEAGAVSVSLENAGNQPILQMGMDDVGLWHSVKVIGLFESGINTEDVEITLSSQLEGIDVFNWQREQLDDQVWEVAWKDHFQPMRFGRRLWVAPVDADISADD
ncbi:MAG TPA: 50S ribosomal protein L11 methyltransferase, partial [Crenotrichaceae bacterium]|nr:50S ribosomal protein L11 methyltransferase [Crenotrichaceae bacterium]